MKKLLLLLLLPILLADSNVSWVPPKSYTDGNQLLPEELLYYTVSFIKDGVPRITYVKAPAALTTIPMPCGTKLTISITTTPIALHPSMTSSPSGPVPYASEVKCVPYPP